MAKFKIGDYIIAKQGAPYGITTNGWRGYVCGIGEDEIWVSKTKKKRDDKYPVNPIYFDLVKENPYEVNSITITRDEGVVIATAIFSDKSVKPITMTMGTRINNFFCCAQTAVNQLGDKVEKLNKQAAALNIKVVCIENRSNRYSCCFSVGKVYKIENGILICDHKDVPAFARDQDTDEPKEYTSFETLNTDAQKEDVKFIQLLE